MVDATARWLVREGSTIYLSQVAFAPTNGTFTYNPYVSGSSDGNWAVYPPTPGLTDINFNQSAATFLDTKFTDINAVGIYFEHDLFKDNFAWAIPGFSVTAAVPEPATVFLLGSVVAGAAGYQFNRHRRNRKLTNKTL